MAIARSCRSRASSACWASRSFSASSAFRRSSALAWTNRRWRSAICSPSAALSSSGLIRRAAPYSWRASWNSQAHVRFPPLEVRLELLLLVGAALLPDLEIVGFLQTRLNRANVRAAVQGLLGPLVGNHE